MLIGDIAVSAPTPMVPAAHEVFLPTYGPIRAEFPQDWANVVVGTSQKVAILHPRLAVAWSGSRIGAASLLTDLAAISKPTLETVEHCIVQQEPSRQTDDVEMLGFLVSEGVVQPFAAHGLKFERVGSEPLGRFAGTGAVSLRATVEAHVAQMKAPEASPEGQIRDAAEFGLCLAGAMMCRDVMSPDSLLQYFGGGYEVVVWGGDGFQKVDDVAHLFFRAPVSAERVVSTPFRIIRVHYVHPMVVFRSADIEMPTASTIRYLDEAIHGVMPPHIKPNAELIERVLREAKGFVAGRVCTHIFIENERGWTGKSVTRLDPEQDALRVTDQGIDLHPSYIALLSESAARVAEDNSLDTIW
jgi:hypothetical protein